MRTQHDGKLVLLYLEIVFDIFVIIVVMVYFPLNESMRIVSHACDLRHSKKTCLPPKKTDVSILPLGSIERS